MINVALAGLGTGLAFIVAIGAQNSFVLRQGIRREQVAVIVLICAGADALLITLGVAGFGAIVRSAPVALSVIRWGGVAFLLVYAILAMRRCVHPRGADLQSASSTLTFGAAVSICLALTFLNPHVYLDTMILLGALANSYGQSNRWWFGGGAIIASFLWFGGLGFGSRLLEPIFASPIAWRVLDGLIALVMLAVALMLALS